MTNRLWTNHENQIFVDLMPGYRKATYQQSIQTIRLVTKDYVNQLRAHPLITDRSQQAVYEHLTYFDDLLEGIGTTVNYGAKDGIYFGKLKSGLRQSQHPLRVLRNRSYYLESNSIEGVSRMVWVNIDIPLKNCTLHSHEECTYVQKKAETPFKGVDILKRDGGWILFENREEADRFCQDQYAPYKLIVHC